MSNYKVYKVTEGHTPDLIASFINLEQAGLFVNLRIQSRLFPLQPGSRLLIYDGVEVWVIPALDTTSPVLSECDREMLEMMLDE